MCGIAGFNWQDEKLVKGMASLLAHRGPDDCGWYTKKNLSLGHKRLSIIDLSKAGHQPMFYSRDRGAFSRKYKRKHYNDFLGKNGKGVIAIVYNGEIYNFQEIRKDLEFKKYSISTKTDTEVILASYLEYGYDCVKKFNGMWSFCIIDFEKNILFCSRDRLGQKPFYYYYNNGRFIFSSELKSLLEMKPLDINSIGNINRDALDLYFSLNFIPAPFSIYKNVSKLEAGHNLIFNLKNKKLVKEKYFEIPDYMPVYNKKFLIEEGREILRDAVRMRMIADVPVGSFLSGGLDSSLVVKTMNDFTDIMNLNTFSIGFEGNYDESKYINIVRNHLKTRHHHYYFSEKDFQSLMETYINIYDEPFADYSGFPTFKVSQMAREKVTVCLSGDGGDEIFAGYESYLLAGRMGLLWKLPGFIRELGKRMPAKKNLSSFNNLFLLKEAMRVSLYPKEELYSEFLKEYSYKPEIYKNWVGKNLKYCLKKSGNILAEALRINDLLFNALPDNFLVKVDRASMANSLEVRSPFLDYRFIEFSQKIPAKWKSDLFRTKKILREISRGYLPAQIVHRGKQGFTPPLGKWILKSNYKPELDSALITLGRISKELAEFYKRKFSSGKNKLDNLYQIKLFIFGKWFERWVKK